MGRPDHGVIHVERLRDTFIEMRLDDRYAEAREADAVYLPRLPDGRTWYRDSEQNFARALKVCVRLIGKVAATGKVLILSRTNRAYGVGLQEFRRTLVAILANKLDVPIDQVAKSVMATSVHKSKGSEAHTVIVLEAEFGRIPMIHPDNTLLEMFGVTSESVLTDERRLFYVAITRARDRLFFLTERGSESPFLRYLDGTTQSGSPSPSVKSPVFGEFSMAIQKQMSTICGFDH